MYPAFNSTNVTTPAIIIKMVARGHSSLAQGKASSSEQSELTLFSYGENSSMTADSKASTAPCSETKARTYRVSLSDRLTRSLITSGLVRGITPSSVRKQLGAPIRAIASFAPAGADAGEQGPD